MTAKDYGRCGLFCRILEERELGPPSTRPSDMSTPTSRLFTGFIFSLSLLAMACGASSISVSSDDTGGLPVAVDDTTSTDDVGDDGDIILGGGPYAVGTLKIVIEHPEADTVTYELACFGDTATLTPDPTDGVQADRACTALAQPDIEQYLAEGPPSDQICTEQYGGPDTAAITGMLNGQDIDITVDRSNGCGIGAWDVLLADILPRALGNL